MDWAVVTWLILLGMVGLLWVMALAVMNDENRVTSSNPSSDEPVSQEAGEHVQDRRRTAA